MKKSLVSEQIVKFVKSDILDIEDNEDHIFKDQLVELISSFIFASCKAEERPALADLALT